jgi:hypothetical protein
VFRQEHSACGTNTPVFRLEHIVVAFQSEHSVIMFRSEHIVVMFRLEHWRDFQDWADYSFDEIQLAYHFTGFIQSFRSRCQRVFR